MGCSSPRGRGLKELQKMAIYHPIRKYIKTITTCMALSIPTCYKSVLDRWLAGQKVRNTSEELVSWRKERNREGLFLASIQTETVPITLPQPDPVRSFFFFSVVFLINH